MRDPMTLAFQIKSPIKRKSAHFPEGYRTALVTIWHVDPQRDGSDDSCGWSRPTLTDEQRDRLKGLAWSEAYEPWFQKLRAKRNENPLKCECLMRGAIILVANVLDISVSWDEASYWAAEMVHSPGDNFRSNLCHIPGYHSNRKDDNRRDREDRAFVFFAAVARWILRERRPWYRHPRWHFWHWHFQVHPIQHFLRWAFTRCHECGGRFRWGQSGIRSWDSPGPRWFRSEHLKHMECDRGAMPAGTASDGHAGCQKN